MNKYVSPIIEIEEVEVEDIMDISLGDDELPPIPITNTKTSVNNTSVPSPLSNHFN